MVSSRFTSTPITMKNSGKSAWSIHSAKLWLTFASPKDKTSGVSQNRS